MPSELLVAEPNDPQPPHHLRKGETHDCRDDETAEDDAEGELPFGETDFEGGVDGAEDADETGGAHAAARAKTQVDRGPTMTLAMMGGSMIWGRRMRLGIWSMLVPMPCAMSPPQRFSRKDWTAKPTICAAHPTMDAPPASRMAS